MANQGNYIAGKVTQRVFDAAKILFEGGAKGAEVSKYLKISMPTAYMIKNAETYDEYKAVAYEKSAKKQKAAMAKKAAIEAKKTAEAKTEQPTPEEKKEYVQPAAQVVEHRQSVTVQTTHFVEGKIDVLIEQMKLINAKLGAIIDDLYGTGKKGGVSA